MRATIAPDSRNRILQVIAESDGYYRSSEIQLDGERAPRTTLVNFKSVPGGVYEVSAMLKGAGGEELAFARHELRVVETAASLR